MNRKDYILAYPNIVMRTSILPILALILLAGASAATTTLYQGTGVNCELIPEKEVLVLTQIRAEYDGQATFDTSFDIPGDIPYTSNEEGFGQHKVFIYATANAPYIIVNGVGVLEGDMPLVSPGEFWTSRLETGARRTELVKPGKNDLQINIRLNETKAGDLVAEVASTACSDAAFEQAGTPAISDTREGCTYGATPAQDGLFVCAPRPADTEVPEWGLVGGLLAASAGLIVLVKRKEQ
jgi:hypothetical protein